MFEVSDEQGNTCIVKDKDLAMLIVKDKSNPFINIFKMSDKAKVSKRHLVKSYNDFLEHFY